MAAPLSSHLSSTVELTLSARHLQSRDVLSASDPFAVLMTLQNGKWVPVGKTKRIGNTNNPNWQEAFQVTYHFEQVQRFLVQVWDHDSGGDHDFGGQVEFTLGSVMGANGQSIQSLLTKPGKKDSAKRGTVIVRGREMKESSLFLDFEFYAKKLDSKDLWGFGKSDPYFELFELAQGREPVMVFRSEYINDNNNPKWKPGQVPVMRLVADGAMDRSFKIVVYDHDNDGSHDMIGEAVLTLNALVTSSGSTNGFELKHPPTKKKYTKSSYKNSGILYVTRANIHKVPSFLDYIAGGCQINLLVGVDYTQSNGDYSNPRSLHSIATGRLNQYQQALQEIGQILLEYDSDKNVAMYGFGGFVNGRTEHCFPLNGNPSNPEVHGIQGMMDVYEYSRRVVQLSGPTCFSHLIREAARLAYNPEVSQQAQSYTVLLLLTDGIINDMDATRDALVEASSLGFSVVIVGVGSADFSAMSQLDGDDRGLVSSRGVACKRDIVQFVPFLPCAANGMLTQETLAELPMQLVSYFNMHKINPNPPLAPTEVEANIPMATAVAPPHPGANDQAVADLGKAMLSQAFQL